MGKVISKDRVVISKHVELKSISQHVSDALHKQDVNSTKETQLLQACVQVISNKILSELTTGTLTSTGKKDVLQVSFSCCHAYARYLDYHSQYHNFAAMQQRILTTVTNGVPSDIRITKLECWCPPAFDDMDEETQACAILCPCVSLPCGWWRHNRIYCCMRFCSGQ